MIPVKEVTNKFRGLAGLILENDGFYLFSSLALLGI